MDQNFKKNLKFGFASLGSDLNNLEYVLPLVLERKTSKTVKKSET